MSGLAATVEELTHDREHGASWMARRAVETLLEVSRTAGRELGRAVRQARRRRRGSSPRRRPGVGAIAGAAGRVLAAANAHRFLDPDELRRLDRRGRPGDPRRARRAGASIAIQLHQRLEGATVLTHSASATVREALIHTPPARAICTVSEPVGEGRAFADELRGEGLNVDLVERRGRAGGTRRRDDLPARRRHRLPRRDALQQDRHDRARRGGAAAPGPDVVACEIVKLAPIDARRPPGAERGRARRCSS